MVKFPLLFPNFQHFYILLISLLQQTDRPLFPIFQTNQLLITPILKPACPTGYNSIHNQPPPQFLDSVAQNPISFQIYPDPSSLSLSFNEQNKPREILTESITNDLSSPLSFDYVPRCASHEVITSNVLEMIHAILIRCLFVRICSNPG